MMVGGNGRHHAVARSSSILSRGGVIAYIIALAISVTAFACSLVWVDSQMVAEQEYLFSRQQGLQTLLAARAVSDQFSWLSSETSVLADYSFPEFVRGARSLPSINDLLAVKHVGHPEYMAHVFVDVRGTARAARYAEPALAAGVEAAALESAVASWQALADPATRGRTVVAPVRAILGRQAAVVLRSVWESDRFSGCLVVVVDLQPIVERYIVPMRSGAGDAVSVVDGRGLVVYDGEKDLIGRGILDGMDAASPDLLRVDRRLLSEQSGQDVYRIPARSGAKPARRLVSWSSAIVGEQRLIVVLSASDDEIIKGFLAIRYQRTILICLFGLILLSATATLFMARQRILERSASTLRSEVARRTAELGDEIAGRVRREEALRVSEAHQRTILEHLPDNVFMFDAAERLVFMNERAASYLGKTVNELLGCSQFDIFPPEEAQRNSSHAREVLRSGKSFREERQLQIPGRGPVWLDTDLLPLADAAGRATAVLGISRDITERKREEAERARAEAQMQHSQKLESLGVLAGGIAHDFNNMLGAILGNAELARQDLPDGSPVMAALEQIGLTARRAAELCGQMLAYAGKGRLVVNAVDLGGLVRDMDPMLRISVSKRVRLRYELADDLPAVKADAAQLRQIVMNLVINASEAIAETDGTVTVVTGRRHCDEAYLREGRSREGLAAGSYVYLDVADTGSGMDAATMEHIFDPFYTTKFAGRGLGLSAVMGIVRRHRGTIRVESRTGVGSTFRVLLPATEERPEPSVAAPVPDEEWRGSGTVLLADDEESVREPCRRMLERLGFEVVEAEDGAQAVEEFRSRPRAMRCVLLDLTMPVMGGEDAFRELRGIDPSVKVLMSSGYTEQALSERLTRDGVPFIQKPFGMEGLRKALRLVLETPGHP